MLVSALLALSIGAVRILPLAWFSQWLEGSTELAGSRSTILWGIRFPRVLIALLVGAGLATSGTALQGIFRNPLADPSIIGLSAGAAMAASVFIVCIGWFSFDIIAEVSQFSMAMVTFLGAAITAWMVFKIAKSKTGTIVITMLLAGIAMNALASSFIGMMSFLADESQLRTLTFWTLGSLGGSNFLILAFMVPLCALGMFGLFRLHKPLNALALGEQEAAQLGIKVESLKRQVVLFSSLLVGATVAFCGIIGFIGLVIPHIIRMIGGPDHRYLFPASALAGGILLLWADTFSRTVVAPAEVPIGVVTALVGAPVFLVLIYQKKKEML
ncbi:MAG: FecCD family ABC transporter permease [Salibacteraceae bacterium]